MICTHCHQSEIVEDNYIKGAARCAICGNWYAQMPKVAMPMSKKQWNNKIDRHELKPCPVVGCNMQMQTSNPNPMCASCATALRNWQKGKARKTAPVFWDADGERWMRRGAA